MVEDGEDNAGWWRIVPSLVPSAPKSELETPKEKRPIVFPRGIFHEKS